jgi:hypothetical protein
MSSEIMSPICGGILSRNYTIYYDLFSRLENNITHIAYQEKLPVSEDGEFQKYFGGLVDPPGQRAVLKEEISKSASIR